MTRPFSTVLKSSVSVLSLAAAVTLSAPRACAMPIHNTPAVASDAKDLGAPAPGHPMTLTVMLKLHDEAKLDAVMEQLYDPSSKIYRKWLTPSDLAAYAPTAAELNAVKAELTGHGYAVLSVDPHNFSLRVRGTAAITERAFQTELRSYSRNNQSFIVHTRDAQLTGAAGALVASVAGLDQHAVAPMMSVAKDLKTGKPRQPLDSKAATPSGIKSQITNIVFGPAITQTATDSNGSTATYTGAQFGPVDKYLASTPQQLQAYYGMDALFKLGYTGKGQKIALLVADGYDAELKDANAFSKIFDLPAFTTKTLKQTYPEGKPLNPSEVYKNGWFYSIALSIDAIHTMAPDAEIDIVASSAPDTEAMLASLQFIVNKTAAKVVSASIETDVDIIAGRAEIDAFNTVLKLGAAQGVAFQFPAGDTGDSGLGSPAGAPGVPAESQYATAVGGTSIVNDPNNQKTFYSTAWGTAQSDLITGNVFSSPYPLFFYGGGGGQSVHIPKPKWQAALPGKYRLTPDVAVLGDPQTSGVFVASQLHGPIQVLTGTAGTGYATPLFSAIWLIAGQYAGHPLGQAAPAISRLKPGQITDVQPPALFKPLSVAGTLTDASGNVTSFDDLQVFGATVPSGQTSVVSGLYSAYGSLTAVGFGIDTSLASTPGWDYSTGYGEPNGFPFITGVAK